MLANARFTLDERMSLHQAHLETFDLDEGRFYLSFGAALVIAAILNVISQIFRLTEGLYPTTIRTVLAAILIGLGLTASLFKKKSLYWYGLRKPPLRLSTLSTAVLLSRLRWRAHGAHW